MLNHTFNIWDVVLLIAVSTMSVILAYMEDPKIKALILSLPIPFSIATMSLGLRVDTTNLMGLTVLLLYTHAVRWFHISLKIPIVLSIVMSAAGYCIIGSFLATIVPRNEYTFWIVFAFTIIFGAFLYIKLPYKDEPGYKSSLSVWIKAPAVMGVVVFLIVIKNMLQGFMTVFPMVGVIGAYESRYSLWTIGRQIPILMLTLGPMMAVIHIMQKYMATGAALACGWMIFLLILYPFIKIQFKSVDTLKVVENEQ